MDGAWLLPMLVLTPLAFAVGVALWPSSSAKGLATIGTTIALALGLLAMARFDWARSGDFQLAGSIPWLSEVGLEISYGVDSVALLLVALTLLLGPICAVASYTAITTKLKTYYGWLLVLQAAMTGVFVARDLILFYVAFEFTLVPMFVLISLFGSANRARAATKFFLYTFTGSVVALAGLVYVVSFNASLPNIPGTRVGTWTTDIATLTESALAMSLPEQTLVMLAMILGFGVKVPIFPFHTWLPLAHTEAPTAGSVILAGVLLKLGTYGLFRFVLPMTPAAVAAYADWLALAAVVGILYGGLICWVQTDVKKLIAYSSVAHLGFCVLGLIAANHTGLAGSVLYMINHGLSTGALFLCIGMMYERYHTRSMREVGGLAARMPVWSTFFVFFTMASVGLPGLNGFVSEFLCLMGAFQADALWTGKPGGSGDLLGWRFALVAGLGMVVAAMYLLIMLGNVVWGELKEPHSHAHGSGHDQGAGHSGSPAHGHALPKDLSAREIGVLLPLAVLCLVLGLFPKPALDAIRQPVDNVVRTVSLGRSLAGQSAIVQPPHGQPGMGGSGGPGVGTPHAAPAGPGAGHEIEPIPARVEDRR